MRGAVRYLVVGTGVLFLTACSVLPVSVDLKDLLAEQQLDRGEYVYEAGLPSETPLQDFTDYLPDPTGQEIVFTPPSLPAQPAAVSLDYKLTGTYTLDCVDNPGGELSVQFFLAAPGDDLWSNPLTEPATTPLSQGGTFSSQGTIGLTPAQRDALVAGDIVVGAKISLANAAGTVAAGCTGPTIDLNYSVDEATARIAFF